MFLALFVSLFWSVHGACTLASAVAAGGCETGVAAGLTAQIVAQLKHNGYTFELINQTDVKCTGSCQPYLQTVAAKGLHAATKAKGDTISLESAYRSCAQQYLLYQWYQVKKCGIQIAAVPGTSNHEGGSAIDTADYKAWKPALEANQWKWYGADDLVHFDYHGSGVVDLRAENLKAFQQLWNKANPSKTIKEDGVYGPATQNALASSPCAGF